MIQAKMALNITSIAEPGEARLPSAPPARRVLYLPKTAPQLAGLARGRAPQARLSRAEERSGYVLLYDVANA